MHICDYDAGPVPFLGALVNNISKVTVGKRLHYNFCVRVFEGYTNSVKAVFPFSEVYHPYLL